MVAITVLLVGAVTIAVLVASGGSDERASGDEADTEIFVASGPAEVGGEAPTFTLPALDANDGPVSLADSRGRPVVLNLWASWCNPCRKEFPLLKAARAKYAKAGLEIIGVSYRDIASDGRAFAESQGATWPLARDPGGDLAAAYGVRAIPQTFFIAPDGTIASRVFGITSAADLDAEIQQILPSKGRGDR